MTLRRAASSTAVKQPQKCRQNRFRKIAEIENTHRVQTKCLIIYSINISLYATIAHNNITNTSQQFKHIHPTTTTILHIYGTQSTQERTSDTGN